MMVSVLIAIIVSLVVDYWHHHHFDYNDLVSSLVGILILSYLIMIHFLLAL
jgi:hypothetical protein